MSRLFAVVFGAWALMASAPAFAASAADLFTVSGVKVDATGESAVLARDKAMAQGRPEAWSKLYRTLTPPAAWPREPMLDDNTLLHLIRSTDVANERRSTTRYLAEVTYRFIPEAVRRVLRQNNIAYAETQAKPALVIPVIAGARFNPKSAWAMAFSDPAVNHGLAPLLLPEGDAEDLPVLSRAGLAQADWDALQPLVRRYNPTEIVIATATEDGKSMTVTEITPMGRQTASFAFANATFVSDAQAVADKVSETWKSRTAVDYGTRARLTADVQFGRPEEWARIRAQLAAVRAVSDVEVVGIMLHEAQVNVSYFGRMEQLRDAMAQQSLVLTNARGQYTLQLGNATASP